MAITLLLGGLALNNYHLSRLETGYKRCNCTPYPPWCWNIYVQSLDIFSWVNVGRYASTMEHMGTGWWLSLPLRILTSMSSSVSWDYDIPKIRKNKILVGGLKSSEKYESVGMIIPN